MSSILLIGNSESARGFVDEYCVTHKILPYEIERFEETLPIASAREIKKKLSFSTSGSKLFIFSNGITVEAQNALLKCVEESMENVHFVFCCEREDSVLPTIASRSKIVKLERKFESESEMMELIKNVIVLKSMSYQDIETISLLCEKDFGKIIAALREIVLDDSHSPQHRLRAIICCKKLLQTSSLLRVSNVSLFVLLESAFQPPSTT